ncbi:MAG: antibiotic biosynthesis monooxygenase [Verrucomicrobia bacterium]|nr:antibiotic biosynthesis monooxygenase [Verrucomicrobiota bacterium]
MIVEYVRYEIPAERHATFLEAYRAAAAHLSRSRHCLRYEIAQGVEEPNHFTLRIEWDSREGHEQGFRRGPEFRPFLALVRPFLADIREMKHYAAVVRGAGGPTLYEWAGGLPALERLFSRFYAGLADEPLLAPLFAAAPADHATRVAAFVGEVLGGPPTYGERYGGHAAMVRHHLGRGLTEAQRRRWVERLVDCADDVGLPDDPEFRSAFVAYLEWGSRLALVNARPGATVDPDAPMPRWGWGEVGGPFVAPPDEA